MGIVADFFVDARRSSGHAVRVYRYLEIVSAGLMPEIIICPPYSVSIFIAFVSNQYMNWKHDVPVVMCKIFVRLFNLR